MQEMRLAVIAEQHSGGSLYSFNDLLGAVAFYMPVEMTEMAPRRHDPEDARKEYMTHIPQLGV